MGYFILPTTKFYLRPKIFEPYGFRIVNFYPKPRHTFCPIVPKKYTFSATKCSPQKDLHLNNDK